MAAEPVPVHALIEHQAFVRTLARQLLRDEHAAEDLAQDTWVSMLTAPPRAIASVRGWLAEVTRNRASNARRERERRHSREHAAAREESAAPVDVAEKVELEQRVVRAVLELREPYRSVILGRYYEGLDTQALAARQGITASSVRSQEARALEMLRRELDRGTGGRAAWSAALLPLAKSEAASIAALAKWALGLTLAGTGVLAVAWWWPVANDASSRGVEGEQSSVPRAAEAGAVVPNEPGALEPELHRAIAQQGGSAATSELEGLPTNVLHERALQCQRELRVRLLTPAPALTSAQQALLALPETGLARILRGDLYGFWARVDPIGVREGGSYYAFTSKSSSYDDVPDLHFDGEELSAAQHGVIVDFGAIELASLPTTGSGSFAALADERLYAAWTALWTTAHTSDQGFDEQVVRHFGQLRLERGLTVELGHVYLLRSIARGDHDLLVALQALERDGDGLSFAWRILQRWPLEGPARARFVASPSPLIGETPAWMKALTTEQLWTLLADLRAVATPRLLTSAPELVVPEATLTRLLESGRFEALVDRRGGGSYLSFENGSQVQDYDSDLWLAQGELRSGAWGGEPGFLLDLGTIELESLPTVESEPPQPSDAYRDQVWRFLWQLRASEDPARRERGISAADQMRARELRLNFGVAAIAGHTYLMRTMHARGHDLIAGVKVLARDADGCTVAWRVLRHFNP